MQTKLDSLNEKQTIKINVNYVDKDKGGKPSRKTLDERPHKRLSFLDEEASRRRSDTKMEKPSAMNQNAHYLFSNIYAPKKSIIYDNNQINFMGQSKETFPRNFNFEERNE